MIAIRMSSATSSNSSSIMPPPARTARSARRAASADTSTPRQSGGRRPRHVDGRILELGERAIPGRGDPRLGLRQLPGQLLIELGLALGRLRLQSALGLGEQALRPVLGLGHGLLVRGASAISASRRSRCA